MEGRLPDFMIIGAMKSGTTSLHDYLGKHPDIFTTEVKEIHYFADSNYKKYNLEWYKNHFVSEKKLVGTSPQSYTKRHNELYKNIPERLHKTLPNIKLIYILRDPLDRYKSHLLENYYGLLKKQIDFSNDMRNPEYTSCYHYQLNEYLKYFDLSQIHILTLEDLKSKRLETLNSVFDFLNVRHLEDDTIFDFISNSKDDKTLPISIARKLPLRILNKLSPIFYQKIIRSSYFQNRFKKNVNRILPSEQETNRLKTVFRQDVVKLKELTGNSFDHWNL
ncbi:sulfotransferase domain-containing protein [Winogradskyella pacifica]|uniref:sulfotransferase domain-containing protein n=1 Tax=Winogradskyella pacifica TaxID=664642 RepID=UPI0015CDC803|nr:sulfotransferase [Winogradskyella pacifica]